MMAGGTESRGETMARSMQRFGRFLVRQWQLSGRISRSAKAARVDNRDTLLATQEFDRPAQQSPDTHI
jgi:hypothetical protein